MSVAAVIPARYASTRFPGKPLALIKNRPMIQRVYENISQSLLVCRVIVATDSLKIARQVERFGGEVVMTDPSHQTGTDRVAEVAKKLDFNIIVNVQGDEPLLPAQALDAAVEPLLEDSTIDMATLMTRITERADILDPNVVKIVADIHGFALYFSRQPIPYGVNCSGFPVYRHIGLYVYRRDFLLRFASMHRTPLEKTEQLEQLRALENGCRIKVQETDYSPVGVDVPDDIKKIEKMIDKQ